MTSRTTTVFRWIWRANGLLLLGTCLAGLVAIAAFSKSLFVGMDDDRPDTVTHVAGTDVAAESLALRAFERVKGTQLLVAALAGRTGAPAGSSVSYSYESAIGSTRNLLFFDVTTRKTHWLFEGNGQRIPSVVFITDPSSDDCGAGTGTPCTVAMTTQAILLQVVPGLDGAPLATKRRIAIASPDGREVTTVTTEADGLLGSHKASATTLLVFYSAKGAVRVAEIDLATRKVSSDTELSDRD